MVDVLVFLAAPFTACLILVAILGYFGIHVLRREVIFVDLALAQIAAMGTVIAFLLDHHPGSRVSFFFSLGATVVGAAIFSLSRVRRERVPHEAIIGITYVVASAATILVADQAPEGAEHLRELLAGAVLWVTWPGVVEVLVTSLAVGGLHVWLGRRFVQISEDAERAFAEGVRVRWWDFVFYVSFGLVITVAVQVAGVLMVFAYLVAPAIIAISMTENWPARMGIAWLLGGLASITGLAASYRWDVPSGPAIVCSLGLFLLIFAGWRSLRP